MRKMAVVLLCFILILTVSSCGSPSEADLLETRNTDTVSYTHLDVYKRQGKYPRTVLPVLTWNISSCAWTTIRCV